MKFRIQYNVKQNTFEAQYKQSFWEILWTLKVYTSIEKRACYYRENYRNEFFYNRKTHTFEECEEIIGHILKKEVQKKIKHNELNKKTKYFSAKDNADLLI